jgi:pyruvate ferredoxin oxidoreductase delta subunit
MNNKKNFDNKGTEFGGVIENQEKNYPQTGEWSQEKPEVSEKCIGCGQCVKLCPEGAIEIQKIDGKNKAIVDFKYCKGCRLCAENCPIKAINMIKKS